MSAKFYNPALLAALTYYSQCKTLQPEFVVTSQDGVLSEWSLATTCNLVLSILDQEDLGWTKYKRLEQCLRDRGLHRILDNV